MSAEELAMSVVLSKFNSYHRSDCFIRTILFLLAFSVIFVEVTRDTGESRVKPRVR